LRNTESNFAMELCISISAYAENDPIRIVSSQERPGKFTSYSGSFLETLAGRDGIPEVIAMPAQQELIGHSRDVVADGDVPRLGAH
jgi:hypothetical protein